MHTLCYRMNNTFVLFHELKLIKIRLSKSISLFDLNIYEIIQIVEDK